MKRPVILLFTRSGIVSAEETALREELRASGAEVQLRNVKFIDDRDPCEQCNGVAALDESTIPRSYSEAPRAADAVKAYRDSIEAMKKGAKQTAGKTKTTVAAEDKKPAAKAEPKPAQPVSPVPWTKN